MLTQSFNLINAGAYIGAKKTNWTPESERFLLGYKNNISIYNISISSFFFSRALNFVSGTVSRGGRGFFFGLINAEERLVNPSILAYQLIGQVVTKKNWRGGYVTNTKFFRSSIVNGHKKFSFVVSLKFDYTNFPVVSETNRMRIPLIMPVDSNSVASNFIYPIPSNSTGFGIIQMYAVEFSNAVFRGICQKTTQFSLDSSKTKHIKKNNSTQYRSSSANVGGRRWNRTTAVSFSGLNSTIELSPLYNFYNLIWQSFLNQSFH